ncbi:MAG: STAS/SEC14 domain-containing protein, partial [Rhodospirillales bacterium]|nr:STAS/SEC14 domain-containing protein [Rhodospirillales bacterium]
MIEFETDEANRVLTITMTGMITVEAIDRALDRLEAQFPQVDVRIAGGEDGGVGVLLDYEHLQGWEQGAKVAGTITGKMLGDVVRRCAIIGEEKWRDEEERVADVSKRAKVRF